MFSQAPQKPAIENRQEITTAQHRDFNNNFIVFVLSNILYTQYGQILKLYSKSAPELLNFYFFCKFIRDIKTIPNINPTTIPSANIIININTSFYIYIN